MPSLVDRLRGAKHHRDDLFLVFFFQLRDQHTSLCVTTAAEISVRYSKWHRLNQEVEKTTRKNKLDKIPYFSYFDASVGSNSPCECGDWIENKKHNNGECNSRIIMKRRATHRQLPHNKTRPGEPLLGAHVLPHGLHRHLGGCLFDTIDKLRISRGQVKLALLW